MLTEIIIILDRSGSMSSIKNDTIGGFNSFLAQQKLIPGEAKMTLVQFDDEYEKLYESKVLNAVEELTTKTFVPRGATALYDAVGRTVNEQGARFASRPAADQPGKVVIAIMTDGEENASSEFNSKQLSDMINEQKNKWNWDFYFFGSNQDAVLAAQNMGIGKNQAIDYASNTRGVVNAMGVLSNAVACSRGGGSYSISSEDRKSTV